MTSLSTLPEASMASSGAKATDHTTLACPTFVPITSPVSTALIRIVPVPSQLALAASCQRSSPVASMVMPSGPWIRV
jgi:hypothetical protein